MRRVGAFRVLLIIGSVLSVGAGVWAILWTSLLQSLIGFELGFGSEDAFNALAKMFGASQIALGVGYALAAAQPRNRSLLAVLFTEPLLMGLMLIAGAARGELRAGNAIVWALVNLAYCMVFFRLYPKVERTSTAEIDQPPEPIT